VEKTVNDLVFAIQLGWFIGTTIAVIAVFLNIFWLLFDYRRRVLQARMGVFEFRREKIPLKATAALPGAIISNSIFIFFVMIFACTIIFSILAWPLFWQILWRIKWSLVSILSGTIINFLIKFIINKLCYNFDSIKRRGLLSIFDFFLLQIAILAGIVSSISRFGILWGVLFLSIMRIDVTALPEWMANVIYIDMFNKSYYASILMQHIHNNPIVTTFYHLCFLWTKPVNSDKNIGEDGPKLNRRKKIRNRLHLWLFLYRNPFLREFRKKNLAIEEAENGGSESSGEVGGITDLENQRKSVEKRLEETKEGGRIGIEDDGDGKVLFNFKIRGYFIWFW
jgi:hypothetical protein